jgi:hypothetical protein
MPDDGGMLRFGVSDSGSGPSVGDGLLLEDGVSFLLLEDGSFLLLE